MALGPNFIVLVPSSSPMKLLACSLFISRFLGLYERAHCVCVCLYVRLQAAIVSSQVKLKRLLDGLRRAS